MQTDRTYTLLQPQPDERGDELIYFAYSAGRIKIGLTKTIHVRHAQLRAAAPFDPTIILAQHGSLVKERLLHTTFEADRLHGEWFILSPSIRDYLRPRLCDIGRDSLDRAERNYRDHCAAFLAAFQEPPKRQRRQHCEHGRPNSVMCHQCEYVRDMRVLEKLKSKHPQLCS